MTEIAAKEEFSGLDAVSELLKDKDIETNEQGRRLLEQYGYWGNIIFSYSGFITFIGVSINNTGLQVVYAYS